MFQSHDIIKIHKVNLSGEDYFVLSNMYLPLIGMNSLSIYLLLENLYTDEIQVKTILDKISLQSPNSFTQNVAKLEGIGLVKKYYNETKGYILQMLSPLSGKAFLKNDILRNYLYNQIGDVEVHNLEKVYAEKKYSGYTDMTLRFDEVFKTIKEKKAIISVNDNDVEEDNIHIRNQEFDYLVFKTMFDDTELPKELLNDKDFEENILKISYQYSLKEVEMKEAIMKTKAINHDLTFEFIAKNAGYIYQNRENTKVLGFDVKEPIKVNHELTSDEEQLIKIANDKSIKEILEIVSFGKPALADLNDYNKLADQTKLPSGVINILIFYINDIKKGEPVNYTYIEKVARNWMKAGVNSTDSAVRYMHSLQEKKTTKGKKKIEKPEYLKHDNNQETLSEEELKEAQELASKLLG